MVACGDVGDTLEFGRATEGPEGTGTDTTPGPDDGDADSTADSTEGTDLDGGQTSGPLLDVGSDDPPGGACHVTDGLDGMACRQSAPADSFDPVVEWSWGDFLDSAVIPLVGNFTDDNGDGSIDLCDTPDVVIVAAPVLGYELPCAVYVLDGATGVEHFAIPQLERTACFATPAFGDIDGDGLPEIVVVAKDSDGKNWRLKAFEHDGTPKWTAPQALATTSPPEGTSEELEHLFWDSWPDSDAVAIHDLDGDGSPEILYRQQVFDSGGDELWSSPIVNWGEGQPTFAVDLDGDGALEVIRGQAAFRADGTVMFDNSDVIDGRSMAQVANVDADPDPEILVTSADGLFLVEHDGTITAGPVTPTGVPADSDNYLVWQRPAAAHDFDGDGTPEWVGASQTEFAVYSATPPMSTLWQVPVVDETGVATGTAFDFLGDGTAEAVFADEYALRVYDGVTGEVLLEQERCSVTIIEYPVVADVDNDGSAEILVVSNRCPEGNATKPALQVFADARDRWVPARRIWNQHAYFVTNVTEEGGIPAVQPNNWATLNTFRTQAQIENGGTCTPVPEG